MSDEVNYPVAIARYEVSVSRNTAEILLESAELRCVGQIRFSDSNNVDEKDLIVHTGGFLEMHRPLSMLSGILDLLQHGKSLMLQRDGTLFTSVEFVGKE